MAASKVFNISELLELILLELPFFDLLRATGINHSFRECIKSTSRLQKNLFLKQTLIGPKNYAFRPLVNPALERLVDITPKGWPRLGGETGISAGICLSKRYPKRRRSRYIPNESKYFFSADIIINTFAALYHLARSDEDGVEESWRNMYLTNLACESKISIHLADCYGSRRVTEEIAGSGTTLDEVVDVFKRFMEAELT